MTIATQLTDRGLYGKPTVNAIEQLVLKHLPGSLPGRCSVIDPLAAARAILREHFDAMIAEHGGMLGYTPFVEFLTGRGVEATTAVYKAAHRDAMRERMRRNVSGGVPSDLFAG